MTGVRHLVVFRVPEPADVDSLTELLGTFADCNGVASIRIERDAGVHPRSYDVLLVTEHDSLADLRSFREDPGHVGAVPRLKEFSDSWVSIDHIIET